jgi:hypothetical protein
MDEAERPRHRDTEKSTKQVLTRKDMDGDVLVNS